MPRLSEPATRGDDAVTPVTARAHEVQGGESQDRTYQFWFKKPNHAKTLIVDGDGRGSSDESRFQSRQREPYYCAETALPFTCRFRVEADAGRRGVF